MKRILKTEPEEDTVDIIGRKVVVGDLVVSNNLIYEVLETQSRKGLRIVLHKKSKSTKPVFRFPWEVCLLPKDAVLLWLLTK